MQISRRERAAKRLRSISIVIPFLRLLVHEFCLLILFYCNIICAILQLFIPRNYRHGKFFRLKCDFPAF
ncbi:hypothetical protein HMPREF9555_01008 [Selenomonas artemidis F0399]|uniref:Uncharacterized protein n=1 Tax=Selenomonas artemidis F0399 TaxID=749551 RepID=E7N1Z7_9FIRM|nr:hypothetical protein HMPREF9555_01008 [Selenomonas artemidis F0399]